MEKLRIDMTKEQVEFVLGRPVLRDSFKDDTGTMFTITRVVVMPVLPIRN